MVPAPARNAARRDYATTVIRYPPGREESARTVAAELTGWEMIAYSTRIATRIPITRPRLTPSS